MTKTIRSRFDHPIGALVEGCTIIEKTVVIPPDPVEKRRGVYDYLVEVPPAAMKSKSPERKVVPTERKATVPERNSFTRCTPEEAGSVIRRLPSR
jgi:hypothetical protein